MKSKHAFTLIEMLVVIAIIALLSSLLMPVINNALERGRITQCAQRLRSIHMGLVGYAADHGGTMPPPWGLNSKDNKRFGYYINPYLENRDANHYGVQERYRCPDARFYPFLNVHNIGMNPKFSTRPYLDFSNLSNTILVADARSAFSLFYDSGNKTNLHARHRDPTRKGVGAVSAAFGDGHWELVPYERIPTSKPWDQYDLLNPSL
ncbi:type II secretion system protein [Kiritimatiellota bacterium B12222]|nr:type II secretion system protein [Kiritimatiellota bacterium B12222]